MAQNMRAESVAETASIEEHIAELTALTSRVTIQNRNYAKGRILDIAEYYASLGLPVPEDDGRLQLVDALNSAAERFELLKHMTVIAARKCITLGSIGW